MKKLKHFSADLKSNPCHAAYFMHYTPSQFYAFQVQAILSNQSEKQ